MSNGPGEREELPRGAREDDSSRAPGAPFEHARDRMEHARDQARDQLEQAREQFDATNEKIKARTGRNLLLAILTGLALGGAVLASLIFVKGIFAGIALIGAGVGVVELVRAFQGSGRRVDLVPQVAAVPIILLPAYFLDDALHWLALFVALIVIVVWRLIAQMAARDGRLAGDVLGDVLTSAFIPVYVPLLASLALALLRQDHGEYWVLAFLIAAIAADTGAYASGLAFGKHPMAPRVSPNKTWEGFAGAALVSLVAGALLAQFMLGLPWWSGLIFGVVILLTATVGDLGESMLKRDLGIKDMSSWIPGHGGVLDRLDSILLSAAAALALYHLLTPLAV